MRLRISSSLLSLRRGAASPRPYVWAALAFILLILFAPLALHAQDFTGQLDDAATEVYGSEDADAGDYQYIISNVINTLLGILGVLFLLLMIYAGFLWMTAGGNTDQVDKAKKILVNTSIGLIILIISYSASVFIFEALNDANLL